MATMAKPTDLLKEEHKAVLQRLADLEQIINDLDQKEKVSAKLKELGSFFDTEFWVHFDKEEKALFPEFDNFMPRGAGPIAVMLEEHVVLRKTNADFQQAVAKYLGNADTAETRRAIYQSGSHFIGTLRDHIFKEDNILFRMAEIHLNAGQMEKVTLLFADIDRAKQVKA
ncbi:MAG: hemerythrin domain-containing protein [Chloroflexi bacterium]|nr:hemerythrin domain-containing protein [Chloroflexota bacterium]